MALAVAALVGAALLPWRDDGAPIAAPTAEQALASPPSGAVGDPARAPAAERAPERAEVSAQSPPLTAAAELAHVRGRCVDEAGAPLAGCVASLRGSGPHVRDQKAKPGRSTIAPITTGADGRFAFAFAPEGMEWALDLSGEHRVGRNNRWRQLQTGQIVELGDVRLEHGFTLRGVVVDEQSAPVARAIVDVGSSSTGNARDSRTMNATSAADGTFVMPLPAAVGTWKVDAWSPGWQRVAPTTILVTERGADPLRVIVRPMPAIQGVVVDDLGEPVASVQIWADAGRGSRTGTRTGADGRFLLHATDDSPTVQLRITDAGRCQLPAQDDPRAWPWGTRDVRIELRRTLTCDLVVVERGSGAPVERFAVRCGNPAQQHSVRLAGDHPGGRVAIDAIAAGPNVLVVIPHDPALLPSEPVTFVATPSGVPPQRIEFERLLPATVRVLRADGTPIAGAKVEIVAKGALPFDADAWVVDRRRDAPDEPRSGAAPHRRVHEATTDSDGRASVFVLAPPHALAVRATGDHVPAIVDQAAFVPGAELDVVPRAHGSIAGVVRVRRLDAASLRVAALDARTGAGLGAAVVVRPDGSFTTGPLPPGRYRLRITHSPTVEWKNPGSTRDAPLDLPRSEVDVLPAAVTRVELDARALDPAQLRGRALVEGLPQAGARVRLQSRSGASWGDYRCDADGVFTAVGLLPDTYRAILLHADERNFFDPGVAADSEFRPAGGEGVAMDFSFVRCRLVVTVRRPDGTPAANVDCIVNDRWRGTASMLRTPPTDADGRLVIDPAPATSLTIEANGSRIDVQIPPGATTHEVALTLPQ